MEGFSPRGITMEFLLLCRAVQRKRRKNLLFHTMRITYETAKLLQLNTVSSNILGVITDAVDVNVCCPGSITSQIQVDLEVIVFTLIYFIGNQTQKNTKSAN